MTGVEKEVAGTGNWLLITAKVFFLKEYSKLSAVSEEVDREGAGRGGS